MTDVKIQDSEKKDVKIPDTKTKDVKVSDTSCRTSGADASEAEKKDRSAAAPDCDCNGTTKQMYDVT